MIMDAITVIWHHYNVKILQWDSIMYVWLRKMMMSTNNGDHGVTFGVDEVVP